MDRRNSMLGLDGPIEYTCKFVEQHISYYVEKKVLSLTRSPSGATPFVSGCGFRRWSLGVPPRNRWELAWLDLEEPVDRVLLRNNFSNHRNSYCNAVLSYTVKSEYS